MLSPRQKLLKLIYPLIMWFKKQDHSKGKQVSNTQDKKPLQLFYMLSAMANNGKEISMSDFKGKKILVVNVASNCGFTGQYEALEKLYKEHADTLVVLGFPANDFKGQEAGSDQEIEQFCKLNYEVSFPLFKKQTVLRPGQNEVYQWLTDETKNGWNSQQPVWNFCKYLIDEEGKLMHFYGPGVDPTGKAFLDGLV